MLTLLAFLFALTLLIAVHEYGHYRMAVACKVQVLVFSIGFGKSLYRWRSKRPRAGQNTEFVIGMWPLGGFIQMLDSREADVLPAQLPQAFDQQSLKVRAAIVSAGPLANLMLAVLIFTGLSWWGQQQALPILASPIPGTWAARAGLTGGEKVVSIQFSTEKSDANSNDAQETVESFQALTMAVAKAELAHSNMVWTLTRPNSSKTFDLEIPSPDMLSRDLRHDSQQLQGDLPTHWTALGLRGPLTQAVLGRLEEGAPAQLAGLRSGDLVLRVNGQDVSDAQQLRDWIRAEPLEPDFTPLWDIQRDGKVLTLAVQPVLSAPAGQVPSQAFRRIGAVVGAPPAMQWVRWGPWDGLRRGFEQVGQICLVTGQLIGKMLTGAASSKHLSGPMTMAEQAGQSAHLGLAAYLTFLALISVSLGLLNLLPLPMLDGGHLMYYLWESMTGKPVSVAWQRGLQKVGLAVLIFIMTLAFFNDLSRLFN